MTEMMQKTATKTEIYQKDTKHNHKFDLQNITDMNRMTTKRQKQSDVEAVLHQLQVQ